MVEEGGAAPPVAQETVWSKGTRCAAGAFAIMLRTIGAPHMCVTRCSAMSRKIAAGSTLRRQTCVPPTATVAQGNDQPLQWNIGSVHRYTLPGPRPKVRALLNAAR